MFEGYLQHDAQELLRCVLSYLQDSEKDLFSVKKNVSEKMPKSETPKNVIMERFLSRCAKVKPENQPQNVFHQPDILDQIEQSEAAKTSITHSTTPVEADTACLAQKEVLKSENDSNNKQRTRTPRGKKANEEPKSNQKSKQAGRQNLTRSKKACDETDGTTASETVECNGGRKKTRTCLSKASESQTEEKMEIGCGDGKTVNGKLSCEEDKKEKSGKQQTILGMFQNQKTGKRLGMSRTVLRNSTMKSSASCQAADVSVNGDCGNEQREKGEKEDVVKCKSAPSVASSMNESPTKSQSSPKQPVVKLEKCDRVCNSPLKSVSAKLATQKLSPYKSDISPSKGSSGEAKQKLDFNVIPKNKSSNNITLTATKTNFIEDLFLGKMMLRTKCCECENCRERIEDFHDISVPVRVERTEECEEEEKDEGTNVWNMIYHSFILIFISL